MAVPETSEVSASPSWPSREGNYFGRHWRGELPLGVSFWVNGFSLGVAYTVIVFAFIGLIFAISDNTLVLQLSMLTVICCGYTFAVWLNIGVWRSAEHHKVHTGRKGWAIVAQILIVINWINLIIGIFDIPAIVRLQN